MPTIYKLILAVIALFLIGGGAYVVTHPGTATTTPPVATSTGDGTTPPPAGGGTGGTICTQDVQECPDGTFVARTGPNCEFAACPTHSGILPYNSGIQGTVLLGPTCPVQRNPPDPQCADKGYATTLSVYRAGSASLFASTQSDANGVYKFSLPPGSYNVSVVGGKVLPRCSPVNATVPATGYVTADISCDTGIR